MDDSTFLERLRAWEVMPDFITDVRDFQVVKTRPYPGELKAQFFAELWAEASEEQRRRSPYLITPHQVSEPAWVVCELFLGAGPGERLRLQKSPLARIVNQYTISYYASRINSSDDVDELRKGLAAAIIADHHANYQGVSKALASLWLAAEHAGIEPLPYFQEAARIARADEAYGIRPSRNVLARFNAKKAKELGLRHNIDINFEHPANAGILRYLGSGRSSKVAPSTSPDSIPNPYWNLGTHPDLVERLWDELGAKLSEDCRWVVYGTPVLVHPISGIIFAFAGGTHTYAFRLPERERQEATRGGGKTMHKYSNGSTLDINEIGEEWVFGGFGGDDKWCLAAYRFAGDTD